MSKKTKKNKEKEEVCNCHEQESDCGCDCSEDSGFERQFYTKEEKIQMLEEYLVDLKAEQKGVEEALEEMRKVN